MQKAVFFLALLLCAGLQTTVVGQSEFQGTVDYKFEINGEGAEFMALMMPQKMVVKYGKKSMMTYFVGGMMEAMVGKIVVDGQHDEVFIVKEDEETVYMMGPEDLEEGQEVSTPKEVVKEKETETIMGYKCQKYKVVLAGEEGAEQVQYIWTTEKLKAPNFKAGSAGKFNMMGNLPEGAVPGFPLKVTTLADPSMDITVTMVASMIDEQSIPKEEFYRPKDYEVKEF
ncbi:MAG: DUF4412 domain-containing protein, partial [Saprospiraceae bacterium]|nr:DUF4412 domain-containing protein [Saprospiraceae bacterium]